MRFASAIRSLPIQRVIRSGYGLLLLVFLLWGLAAAGTYGQTFTLPPSSSGTNAYTLQLNEGVPELRDDRTGALLQTAAAKNGETLTIEGSGADQLNIIFPATSDEITLMGTGIAGEGTVIGPPYGSIVFTSIEGLTIDGGGGEDRLHVDASAGIPLLEGPSTAALMNPAFDASGRLPGAGNVGIHFEGDGDDEMAFTLATPEDVAYFSGSTAGVDNSGIVNIAGEVSLSFEGLAPMTFVGAGGTLTLDATATPATTTLTHSDSGGPIGENIVTGDGGFEDTTYSGFDALVVRGGDGAETMTVASIDAAVSGTGVALTSLTMSGENVTATDTGADTINLQDVPATVSATIMGGGGSDTINIGTVANSLGSILGPVMVEGEAHDAGTTDLTIKTDTNTLDSGDILNLNDQGDAGAFTYALDATTFARTGIATITYGTIETLNLNTSIGAADIDVTSTAASVNTTITSQDAADDIDVATTGVDSNVIINSASGADDVNLVTTGIDGGDASALGSFTQVNGGGDGDTLTEQGSGAASRLELNGQGGTDTINTEASGALSVTNINAGDNTDTVNLGSTANSLGGILGEICVEGDAHDAGTTDLTIKGDTNTLDSGDILNLNDQGDAGAFTYALDATTFARTGIATLTYGTIETLNLNTSMGAADIDVLATTASVNTTITSQDAADDIDIATTGADSNVIVNSASGADDVNLVTTGGDSFNQVNGGDAGDTLTEQDSGAASRVELNGQGGTDTINTWASGALSVTNLNAGDNTDTINVGSASNSLSGILGDICVEGDAHDAGTLTLSVTAGTLTISNTLDTGDILNLNDQGDAGSFTYALTATTFARTGIALITYGTIETLNLNTSMGAADVDVTSTTASVNTTITSQDAADDIDVTTTGATSNVTINSAAGADDVDVVGTGVASVLHVNGGSDSDGLTLEDSGDGSGVQVQGQDDDDTLTANDGGANGAVRIDGNGDINTLAFAAPTFDIGSGNLHVLNTAVTQAAPVIVGGSTTLDIGTDDAVLDNIANDFNTVTVVSGDEVSLADANSFDLLTSSVTTLLTLVEGTMFIDNPEVATVGSAVIEDGGILAGDNGTIAGPVTVESGGTASPGSSPDQFNTGALSLSAGSTFEVEINGLTPGPDPGGHDQLVVTGPVDVTGATLSTTSVAAVLVGMDEVVIIDNDGADAVTGTFAGLAEGALFSDATMTYAITYAGGDGNDVVLAVPEPDLTAEKTFTLSEGTAPAQPGETITYTVVITNAGGTATVAEFTDTVDANTFLDCTTTPPTTSHGTVTACNDGNGGDLTVAIGTINGFGLPPDPVTITYTAFIDNPISAGVEDVSNQGTVTATNMTNPELTDDPGDATSDADPTVIPVDAMPIVSATLIDTQLTDADGDGKVDPGDTIGYDLMVTNDGDQDVADVIVTQTVDIDTDLNCASLTVPAGAINHCNAGPGGDFEVDLTIVDGEPRILAPKASKGITFEVTVVVPFPAGRSYVETQATVDFTGETGAEQTVSDDPATPAGLDPTQTPIDHEADLELTKIVGTDAPGDYTPDWMTEITFTIDVTNQGPVEPGSATVKDVLPDGLTFVSHTTTQGTYNPANGEWTTGGIGYLDTATLTITALVETIYPVTNHAEVTVASLPDPDSAPNDGTGDDYDAVTITPVASDLKVNKSKQSITEDTSTDPATITVRYLIKVLNNGPSDATGVVVTDPVPEDGTFVSAAPSQGTYTPVTGLWTVGALVNGETAEMVVTITGTSEDGLLNVAEVTGTQPDHKPSNNRSGALGQQDPSSSDRHRADLSLEKTVDNASPSVGDIVTYTVLVKNLGPHATSGVLINEGLPSGLELVSTSSSSTAGPCTTCGYNDTSWIWSVGAVPEGATVTLTLMARVTEAGAITNTVSVRESHLPDPDLTNNTSSASLTSTSAQRDGIAREGEESGGVPKYVELGRNYPNPFNPETVIPFGLPESGHVRVEVYNVLGRKVATLVDAVLDAGRHTVTWRASELPTGLYLVRMLTGSTQRVQRITLVK